MQKGVTKEIYYAMLIKGKIMELFNEEEGTFHIDMEELNEDNNATHFIHALSCACAMVHNDLTGKEMNWLQFNHLANQLCFQYMKERG